MFPPLIEDLWLQLFLLQQLKSLSHLCYDYNFFEQPIIGKTF